MSEKTINVLNTRDRYYNGAYKGQVLEVAESEKEHYLQAGFVVVGDDDKKVEKKNIVPTEEDKKDDRTKKELQEILDHNGIQYDKNSKKADLVKLVEDLENAETEKEEVKDIEAIKKLLIKNALVSQEDLETMDEASIENLAKENGLV